MLTFSCIRSCYPEVFPLLHDVTHGIFNIWGVSFHRTSNLNSLSFSDRLDLLICDLSLLIVVLSLLITVLSVYSPWVHLFLCLLSSNHIHSQLAANILPAPLLTLTLKLTLSDTESLFYASILCLLLL